MKKKTLAQRIAADPALKAKYLSNPGLRSKLPDSMLTPAQRKQRAMNKRLNSPVTEGSKLTGRDLAREANTATSLRYGPAEAELEKQRRREEQTGRDMAGYYDAYRAELQAHAGNVNQIGAQATQQIGALGAGLRDLDQRNLNAQQIAANADALRRGATAGDLAQTASPASAVRQALTAGMGAQAAQTGAAASRYADTRANVVAPGQQLQGRAVAAQRVRDVGDKQVTLGREKGDYNQTYRAGRVSDEAKNVLAMQALGLDVKKAEADAAEGAARIDIARGVDPVTRKRIVKPQSPSAQKTAADLAFFRQHGYYPPTGPPKKGAAKAGTAKTRTAISTAAADARYALGRTIPVRDPEGKPTGKTRKPTQAEVRATLRKKYKDADVANAAMDLAINGYVSPENVRRLRARGITLPASLTRPPHRAGRKKALSPTLSGLAGSPSNVSPTPPASSGVR